MKPINFQDYRTKIIQALVNKGIIFFDSVLNTGEYILVDQFINQPISAQITGNVVIGGPTLPIVLVANIKTGELRFFALKALIPEITI